MDGNLKIKCKLDFHRMEMITQSQKTWKLLLLGLKKLTHTHFHMCVHVTFLRMSNNNFKVFWDHVITSIHVKMGAYIFPSRNQLPEIVGLYVEKKKI